MRKAVLLLDEKAVVMNKAKVGNSISLPNRSKLACENISD